jgi:hypothetical protein
LLKEKTKNRYRMKSRSIIKWLSDLMRRRCTSKHCSI